MFENLEFKNMKLYIKMISNMITSTLESNKLSIKKQQTFKPSILKLNNITIDIRICDGYVNLSKICEAGKKQYSDWKRNKKTEAFLEALSSSLGRVN
jgi:hypothetical protein